MEKKRNTERPLGENSAPRAPLTQQQLDQAKEAAGKVGIGIDELTAIYILNSVKYLGPQSFKELHEAGLRPIDACADPSVLPTKGLRGDKIRAALRATLAGGDTLLRERAARQILAAHKHRAEIVTYSHPAYPPNLFRSNYPAPLLYVCGSVSVLLLTRAVACVGTRKIRLPYIEWEQEFVRCACADDFVVVSGFAMGADSVGHEQAWKLHGKTICVMPSGLDRPFPPENRGLWKNLLEYEGAAMVSESPFGTSASSLTLRKRNKLIVALASGVLVAQSSDKGGAMNAYRFALEQRKPIATFAPEDKPDTTGNRVIQNNPDGAVLTPDKGEYSLWLRKLYSSI